MVDREVVGGVTVCIISMKTWKGVERGAWKRVCGKGGGRGKGCVARVVERDVWHL